MSTSTTIAQGNEQTVSTSITTYTSAKYYITIPISVAYCTVYNPNISNGKLYATLVNSDNRGTHTLGCKIIVIAYTTI